MPEGWKCLQGIPQAGKGAQHRTLHSPSMVASTAPPGQNSIMIWGNKEELNSGPHLSDQSSLGREDETKALGFASPQGKAVPLPHTGMQRLLCSSGHILAGIPSTNTHPSPLAGSSTLPSAAISEGQDCPHHCNTSSIVPGPVPGHPP